MQADLPLEIERKYLIAYPPKSLLETLPEVSMTEITQTYLLPKEEGFGRRVRKRGTPASGWEYTYTRKKPVGFGEKIELEDVISEADCRKLLKEADPAHHTIKKVRCCFVYEGQFFELDLYDFSETLATLEIELPSIDTPVQLPPWIELIEDVTGKPGYSNFSLSETLQFPPNNPDMR